MNAFRTAALVAAAIALAQTSALAQTAPGAAANDVVVAGHRTQDALRSFASDITVQAGDSQTGRWDQRVCPGILGLRREQAQAVADHIAARALEVGLDVGEPGCRPNILVVVTNDAHALASDIVENHADLVGAYSNVGVNTRGRAALNDFVNTPRAVRWWHVAQTVAADGFDANPGTGMTRTTRDNDGGSGLRAPGGASRINANTRQDFSRSLIIVDGSRVAQTPVGQLGDYIAMVALAQLDPDADTSAYPTILNLFSPAASATRPVGLTDWDQAYLRQIYTAPRNRRDGFAGE